MTKITREDIISALKGYLLKKGFVIVNMLQNEVQLQIDNMELVDTGQFINSLQSSVDEVGDNVELTLTSTVPYAVYLEYGTYDYWKAYGLRGFPKFKIPKKKNLSKEEAKQFPKGMQPFAPFRRGLDITLPKIKEVFL